MPLSAPMQAQPQGFSGPASPPSGNPGMEADALTKVRGAAQILEQALPHLPFGGDAHKAVLSAIQGLSKVAPAAQMPQGVQQTMLQGMGQSMQQNAMLQMLRQQMAAKQQSGGGMAPQGGAPSGAMGM